MATPEMIAIGVLSILVGILRMWPILKEWAKKEEQYRYDLELMRRLDALWREATTNWMYPLTKVPEPMEPKPEKSWHEWVKEHAREDEGG